MAALSEQIEERGQPVITAASFNVIGPWFRKSCRSATTFSPRAFVACTDPVHEACFEERVLPWNGALKSSSACTRHRFRSASVA